MFVFLLLEIEAESAVSAASYIERGRRRFVAVGPIRNSKWRDRGCNRNETIKTSRGRVAFF